MTQIITGESRVCPKCLTNYPIELFMTGGKRVSWCRECRIASQKAWAAANPDRVRKNKREAYRRLRRKILEHYGGSPPFCACCGETTYQFLALDHINGGGLKHLKEIGGLRSGYVILKWIRRNGFPGGFQVLCHNCNNAKAFWGACPHVQKHDELAEVA